MNAQYLVVYCTCPDQAVAERIAEALVTEKLAACVNIVANIVSIYRWQDSLQRDSEVLLIIKTREATYARLETCIQELHPYDVAEVIALPIVRGSNDYMDWLHANINV